MRQKIMKIGQELHDVINAGERAQDTALAHSSKLLGVLLEARLELGLSSYSERELIAQVGQIVSDGVTTRERCLGIHDQLSMLCKTMGIDPRAFGNGGKEGVAAKFGSRISLVEPDNIAA